MADSVRIVLADDHAILRSGLNLLVSKQPGWEVVGEASTGQEALEQVERHTPDVLLLDLNMPHGSGLEVIPAIMERSPHTRIIVLTMHDDSSYFQQAMQVGVAGYVLKKAVDTELIMAIQAVLRGEIYVHPAMTQYLLRPASAAAQPDDSDPWRELSEREFDVLKRVALGYTNAEIGDELYLSTKTVETYRARGMEKLGLQTRAQLVRSAMEHKHLE